MRKRMGMIVLTMLYPIFLSATNLAGYWTATERGVTILIEDTYDGFKAKRTDKSQWFYYTNNGRGSFIDGLGNRYEKLDNQTLIFYNQNGRNLTFKRGNNTNREYYNNDNYNRSDRNNNYNYNRNQQRLEGQWINESTGQKILIKETRRGLKVKAFRRDGWTYFRPNSRGIFIDDRGNSYTINRRNLLYESFNGDFQMRFIRY